MSRLGSRLYDFELSLFSRSSLVLRGKGAPPKFFARPAPGLGLLSSSRFTARAESFNLNVLPPDVLEFPVSHVAPTQASVLSDKALSNNRVSAEGLASCGIPRRWTPTKVAVQAHYRRG